MGEQVVKTTEDKFAEYRKRREAEGVVFMFKDGKHVEFSEQSWARLNNRRKAQFDNSGIVSDIDIQVTHHSPIQEKIDISPIQIKEDEIITKTGLEGDKPVKKSTKEPVDEPVADETTITEKIEAYIKAENTSKEFREVLKTYFKENDIEFNIRATTSKLAEHYVNTKQKN